MKETDLRWQLRQLPREMDLPKDLWPAIEAGIRREPVRRPPVRPPLHRDDQHDEQQDRQPDPTGPTPPHAPGRPVAVVASLLFHRHLS